MGARSRMQHRLFLQRNSASADSYGHRGPPLWGVLSTTAGHVWVMQEDTHHDAKLSKASTRYRGIVPTGTDVTESDRVEKTEDRAGTQLFSLMDIDAVIRRKDHLELRMRGHV